MTARLAQTITFCLLVMTCACVAHEGPLKPVVPGDELAATPTAVEQCNGDAAQPGGEQCVETVEDAGTIRCSYTARRELKEFNSARNELDRVILEVEPSGAFVFRVEEVAEENRFSKGRKVFTTSRLETEYRETSDGVGSCRQPDGQSSPCDRDAVVLGIGDDPCSARYLSVAANDS